MKPATKIVLALLRLNPDGLTQLECLHDGGGFRLSGRILELKQAGYRIADSWETTPNGARVKRYRLVETAQLSFAGLLAQPEQKISA